MTTVTVDSGSASSTNFAFVRYLADCPKIAPSLVFRRLLFMGGFLLLGVAGVAAALTLLALDVPQAEPARLLTAFGFVASAVVVVATATSAFILLWGAFVSLYVENLELKAENMEAGAEKEKAAVAGGDAPSAEMAPPAATPEAAVQANSEVVQIVTGDVDAIVKVLVQTADDSQKQVARNIREELAELKSHLTELQNQISPGTQLKMYDSLRHRTQLLQYVRLRKMVWKPEPSREAPEGLAASGE